MSLLSESSKLDEQPRKRDEKTAILKLKRLKEYLNTFSNKLSDDLLSSIRSESLLRRNVNAKGKVQVDTYFYIGNKKFRSNKEVARYFKLLPSTNKGIFHEASHVEIGSCEIEDEPKVWRRVRLWRAKGGNVVLDFGKNEFEGIDTRYHFDQTKLELKDPDGDPIALRDFVENKKVDKENTPRKQNKRKLSADDDDDLDMEKKKKMKNVEKRSCVVISSSNAEEEEKMDVDEEEEEKMDLEMTTPTTTTTTTTTTSINERGGGGRRKSSRSRKRVNYCELADREDDNDLYFPGDDDEDDDDIFEEKVSRRNKKRSRKTTKKKKKTNSTLSKEEEITSIDPAQATFVSEMISLAKSRRATEKKNAVKRRTARAKSRNGSTDETEGSSSYFDPRLSGGDISQAPQKILREQFMRVWDLLSDAHLKHKDFDFNGHGLKFQTACSGTDAPIIAMQMCREMAEEASEAHPELANQWKFDFEHNMSCEVVPFKQAYLTRNFCGPQSKVKVFADIMDLANESGMAKTAFGGESKVPEGTVFLAGTSCKSFSGLRTFNRVENLREKTISGETFFAAVA